MRLPFLFATTLVAPLLSAETAFSPDLFPGIAGKSEAEIRLAGVSALNPGRILDHDPAPANPVVSETRKTRVAELPRGGEYVRLYTLDTEALESRVGMKPIIVDCRYLATAPEDLKKCLSFGAALGSVAAISYRGDYPGKPEDGAGPTPSPARPANASPVVVIVNRRTSGPLEAVLASLQSVGTICLVGGNTAGLSGAYRREGSRWILSGELKPDNGVSLVGTGVTPKFPVKTTPEDEFLVWQLVERGTPLSGVLRRDGLGSTSAATKPAETGKTAAHPESTDVALQRATDILAALGVLGGEGK